MYTGVKVFEILYLKYLSFNRDVSFNDIFLFLISNFNERYVKKYFLIKIDIIK